MKVSHIMPSPARPIPHMQDMNPGDVGIVYGRYVLCLPDKKGFVTLDGRIDCFSIVVDHPVNILPKGTVITLILE
jgi:hypothetical protein